jgi:chromosome partitioning protein
MPIITIANMKGGVGKTTVSTCLAACFLRGGAKTVLVDADPQGSSASWTAAGRANGREMPECVQLDAEGLDRELRQLAKDNAVVIVDAPPRLAKETRTALVDADVVLLPTTPGAFDIWALQDTLKLLEKAPEGLRPFVVPNRTDHTTMAELMQKSLPKLGVPVLGRGLGNRVAFREAALAGACVVDYAPGSAAADEMTALYRAVKKLVS